MTVAQYEQVFRTGCAPAAPSGTQLAPPGFEGVQRKRALPAPPIDPALVQATAAQLLDSDDFVAALADETGELLFTGHFRERLRTSLAMLLAKRMDLHASALAHLKRVREELDQPWRLTSGGKDGEPTPTPHLIGMAGEAHHEVARSEEALLKTIRLALEEGRQNKEAIAALGGRPSFTGDAEAIPVPPELDAAERETVRSLLHLLRREVEARAEKRREPIDVTPSPADTADEDTTLSGAPEPFPES